VDWQETVTGRADGLVKSRTSWTAKLTIRVIPSDSVDSSTKFGKIRMGFTYSAISWTPR
jgi:hypothetical protein